MLSIGYPSVLFHSAMFFHISIVLSTPIRIIDFQFDLSVIKLSTLIYFLSWLTYLLSIFFILVLYLYCFSLLTYVELCILRSTTGIGSIIPNFFPFPILIKKKNLGLAQYYCYRYHILAKVGFDLWHNLFRFLSSFSQYFHVFCLFSCFVLFPAMSNILFISLYVSIHYYSTYFLIFQCSHLYFCILLFPFFWVDVEIYFTHPIYISHICHMGIMLKGS